MKRKEKMWGTWHIISPLSEKEGGRVPHVLHLMIFSGDFHSCSVTRSRKPVGCMLKTRRATRGGTFGAYSPPRNFQNIA